MILRRVGDIQDVMAVYHIPAALHPDSALWKCSPRCWARLRLAVCTRLWWTEEGRPAEHER